MIRFWSGTPPRNVTGPVRIDVRVYLGGEAARAATQKLSPRDHSHMDALFTNTILAFR